ncbi:MAG: hypothetical protein SWJ54_07535, partial [Cyanobacteriota bacterium]|nr:hypothetical protein [Cyanobacteriota bacterium]
YGNGADTILLQGGITEADLVVIDSTNNVAGDTASDVLILLPSTGEFLAVLPDITVAEFNLIRDIQPI